MAEPAANSSWEVVSSKKGGKNVKESMTKAKKKSFIETMPRIEAKGSQTTSLRSSSFHVSTSLRVAYTAVSPRR